MKATLVYNPRAGRSLGSGGLGPAIEFLRREGWELSIQPSSGPGDATQIARAASAANDEVLLVAGGDGTLNEAVQGVAGSETALGYLPYGTMNVWARELHIPLNMSHAARAIARGHIERVDLGIANDRYFLLMAGIGFDSELIRRAKSLERHKPRFGILPYVLAGLATVPLYRGIDVELRYDGLIRRVEALMVVIGNTRLYGGYWRLTPNAVANDGLLDLCIIKGRGSLAMLRQSLPLLLSRGIRLSDVELLRVSEVRVQSIQELPVQLDGELVGSTPVHFKVAAGALRAIVPRGFSSDLIA